MNETKYLSMMLLIKLLKITTENSRHTGFNLSVKFIACNITTCSCTYLWKLMFNLWKNALLCANKEKFSFYTKKTHLTFKSHGNRFIMFEIDSFNYKRKCLSRWWHLGEIVKHHGFHSEEKCAQVNWFIHKTNFIYVRC